MSRIRSTGTTPEIAVRSMLHRLGYRFRLSSKLPGKPDIVLPKHRTAILVHGCFWHRHENCKFCYTPKSNTKFWLDKFEQNVRRDNLVYCQLKEAGWIPMVVWECELADPGKLQKRLRKIGKAG